MHRNIASRFALSTLIAAAACARVGAQSPSSPAITLTPATGTTVHQKAGMVPIGMTVSDPTGIVSASLSGGYSSASGIYPNPPTSTKLTLYFYVGYLPLGDYTFTATAWDTGGRHTTSTITLHLLP